MACVTRDQGMEEYGAARLTCDYCHQPTHTPVIFLGLSSRPACSTCAVAIIKLSICWTCGEVICLGDESVGFGWCFWHRECYGCLFCGSRVAAYSGSNDRPLQRTVEISEPPICAGCNTGAETESQGRNGEHSLREYSTCTGAIIGRGNEITGPCIVDDLRTGGGAEPIMIHKFHI